jgi:hypothetical protein
MRLQNTVISVGKLNISCSCFTDPWLHIYKGAITNKFLTQQMNLTHTGATEQTIGKLK